MKPLFATPWTLLLLAFFTLAAAMSQSALGAVMLALIVAMTIDTRRFRDRLWRAARGVRESTAVGLMLAGVFVALCSFPLYVAQAAGVA